MRRNAGEPRGGIVRSRVAWPLALPLLSIGLFAAHEGAYRLVITDPHERAHVLSDSGHQYMANAAIFLGALAALLVVAFVWRVLAIICGRRGEVAPAWLFGLLPALAFVFQEYVERALHGDVALTLAVEPVFVVGLLLQIPVAAAALLLARALEGLAEAVALTVAATPRRRRLVALPARPRPASTPLRRRPLVCAASERGPPAPVLP